MESEKTVSNNIDINIEGLDEFLKKVEEKQRGFQKEVETWLDGSGHQFLEEVQKMIVSMQVVDTRRLLNSFDSGGQDGVWEKAANGLQLTIGTNLDYAKYVNDGHWTDDPGKGRASRFIPGSWSGSKFRYSPGSNTGMVLKLQYIEARPFFDNAKTVFKVMLGRSFESKLREWVDKF